MKQSNSLLCGVDVERNFLDTLQNDPKYKFVVQFKELFRYLLSPPPNTTALATQLQYLLEEDSV